MSVCQMNWAPLRPKWEGCFCKSQRGIVLPSLQWILCWLAAQPPNVQTGTPLDPRTGRLCGRTLQTESYTRKDTLGINVIFKGVHIGSCSIQGRKVPQLTTCRILFSVSYTEQSWGTIRENCYLKRIRQNGVIIRISAVGGYKQKPSSLAPITPNTPTQDMHKHKTNESPVRRHVSLSFPLPVFLSLSL